MYPSTIIFKSIILLQFSFLSICLIGKLIFLYTYLIGDSKLGPYLTLTLFFFKERKISSEWLHVMVKKNKLKLKSKIFSLIKFLFIFFKFNFSKIKI